MISASAPGKFVGDEEERHIFEELARDIALGMHKIEIEEELQKSKERYRKYFEKTGDAIFILEMGGEEHGKILDANPEASEQTGYSRDELIGMNLVEDISVEKIDRGRGEINDKLARGETVRFTEKKRSKDGKNYWTEVVVTPLKYEGKKANLTINRDITRGKQTEKALRESESKFRQIVEQTHDGIYIYRENRFLFVNDRASEISGYSKKELYDMNVWALIHPEDRPAGKEIARKRRRGEEVPSTFESRIIRKDGEVRYGEFAVTPINYQGEYATLGAVRDITGRREASKKLKESFIQLAETTSRVLGVRDPYTQQHEQRVAELAREVGRRMDLNEDELLGLYLGGILHDIGKIAIPETILTKPGDLKEVEWQMIRSHPEVGYNQILEDTDFPWPVAEMTLHHHERLDGSGYPDGLEGDELTTEVRILGAVDVVEAMSTMRPYRSARSKEETLEEIKSGKGTKYDPEVVEILVDMIGEGEIEFD
jgi:PAS domain S-box-containing protein